MRPNKINGLDMINMIWIGYRFSQESLEDREIERLREEIRQLQKTRR